MNKSCIYFINIFKKNGILIFVHIIYYLLEIIIIIYAHQKKKIESIQSILVDLLYGIKQVPTSMN